MLYAKFEGLTRGSTLRITRQKAQKSLETFIESLEPQGLAELTIKNYGKDLDLFFRWWGQGSKGSKRVYLTSMELSQYREYMVHEKRFRPSTVNRRLESLRKFCRWAARQGLCESDLAEGLKAVRNQRRQCPLSLEDAEVHVLLREAGASQQSLSDRNYALIQLFLQTGIRVAECAALVVQSPLPICPFSGECSSQQWIHRIAKVR